MTRRRTEAYIAAKAELRLLLEQTVPEARRVEVSRAIARFTAASILDDRQHVAAQAVTGESRAIFEEIFGDRGVFDRIFGMGGRR